MCIKYKHLLSHCLAKYCFQSVFLFSFLNTTKQSYSSMNWLTYYLFYFNLQREIEKNSSGNDVPKYLEITIISHYYVSTGKIVSHGKIKRYEVKRYVI